MAVSVMQVMRSVRNFFNRKGEAPLVGVFSIVNNVISPDPNAPYVAITGSRLHNGVYACFPGGSLGGIPEGKRASETFEGKIWLLYPPDDFLALCEKISAYDDKVPIGTARTESFGDYSIARGTNGAGGIATWQEAFASQLREWRKMFTEVDV